MARTSTVDRVTGWFVDRLAYVNRRIAINSKADYTPNTVPIGSVGAAGENVEDYLAGFPDEKRMRLALVTSWIKADLDILAREVSSADLWVVNNTTDHQVKEHEFSMLMQLPNPFVTRSYLLQQTVYWLGLDGNAYWYLAPASYGDDSIREIWPVPANRMKAVGDDTTFIKYYLYKQKNKPPKRVDPKYICHFMLPNPFDLINGLSLISGAGLAMDTDLASGKYMRDLFAKGRGVPASVISLSREVSDRDLVMVETQLREDFEQERKIAIVRAGEFDVKTVGISTRDLDIINSRKFSRDEIDGIFLGLAYNELSRGSSDVADKALKDRVVRPLHVMLAEQITIQIMKRFYGDKFRAEFEDIRPVDRAMRVQEAAVYNRWKTVDEARQDQGLAPMAHGQFPGLGDLLVPWAMDPSFITLYYGIGLNYQGINIPGRSDQLRQLQSSAQTAGSRVREQQTNMQDTQIPVPSLPGADSPQRVVSTAAGQKNVNLDFAAVEGIRNELKRWRKVALKEFEKGHKPADYNFGTVVIPPVLRLEIKSALGIADTKEKIADLFDGYVQNLEKLPLYIVQ